MDDNLFDFCKGINNKWDKREANMLSPLQLAYIGDAVYELLVRTYLLSKNNIAVNDLHKRAVKFVSAKSQAEIVFSLEDKLSEEEWRIVKRGRNAKSGSVPKNADITDYKYATGFESLMGYLYLIGEYNRIFELFNIITLN